MTNARRFERFPLAVEVEVEMPGRLWNRKRVFKTRDLSNGGLFVLTEGVFQPEVGAVLAIRLRGRLEGEVPPLVHARVVRVTPEGLALCFVTKKK